MTALYRKYRPQRFSDVVGQDVAVRTLRNAIDQQRVAHAYLFTGTKGTGKTTLAKLLAKAMNCEQGPTTEPCGECDTCVAIAEGRSLDVVEIDAASNRGIDDVRERIIETVSFQPSTGTRRVYIVDEAHQLTPAAFNALLKTIEEPPPHVLFVFCTTEAHMMMATVRDRCQRVSMQPPGAEALLTVLARVIDTESIGADEPALRAIAHAAQGSFRNALGMLEMLSTTFNQQFTLDDVLTHLGVVSEDVLFDAADAVLAGDAARILVLVEQLVQQGIDLDQFARTLAEHMRAIMLTKHDAAASIAIGDAPRLAAQAAAADEARLLAAIDCIADAITRIKVGSDPRLSIEAGLARACQGLGLPALAMRLAVLEHKISGGYGAPLDTAAAAPAKTQPATRPAAAPAPPTPARAPAPAAHAPAPAAATKPPARPAPDPEPVSDAELENVAGWWPSVVRELATSASFRPVLQGLSAERIVDGKLIVRQAAATAIVTPKLRDAMLARMATVTGRKVGLEVAPPAADAAPDSAPAAAATADAPAAAPASSDAAPAREADAGADVGDTLDLFQRSFDATDVP